MEMKLFSIVVVCLNAGSGLSETVESVLRQTCMDYEVIVKDGGSRDGSVEALIRLSEKYPAAYQRVTIYQERDRGIYEAMNQAVAHTEGAYLLFLNCYDHFFDDRVLERVARLMENKNPSGGDRRRIYYGDVFEKKTGEIVASNPHITPFACYRNIPCHQVCFYDRRLFEERQYDPHYRVRADYEHFLWSYFVKRAELTYLPLAVSSYEGGGFSETKENRKISKAEHKKITSLYMSHWQLLGYRLVLLLTLAPLRRYMAENRQLAGIYQRLKKLLYRKK